MQLSPKHDEFFKQFIIQLTNVGDWSWPSPLETDKVYRGEKEMSPYKRSISFFIKKDGFRTFYLDYLFSSGDSNHHGRVFNSGKRKELESFQPISGYSTVGDLEKDKAAVKNFVDNNIKVEQLLIEKGLALPSPYTASLLPDDEKFFVEEINKITEVYCWAWPTPLKFGKVYRFVIFTAGSRGCHDFRFVIHIDANGVLYMDHLLRTDDYSSHNRLLRSGESIRLENYGGQWGRAITGDEEIDKFNHQKMILTNEEVLKILKEKGLEW